MHVRIGQHVQNFRCVFQPDPVELNILAGGEMPVIAVVRAGNMREHAHLLRIKHAVGNGYPQHIRMQLEIQAVHQAKRLEFFFRQSTGQTTFNLIFKLSNALLQERAVNVIISIMPDAVRQMENETWKKPILIVCSGVRSRVGRMPVWRESRMHTGASRADALTAGYRQRARGRLGNLNAINPDKSLFLRTGVAGFQSLLHRAVGVEFCVLNQRRPLAISSQPDDASIQKTIGGDDAGTFSIPATVSAIHSISLSGTILGKRNYIMRDILSIYHAPF